ncbi:MAG: DeoR family transcriptional regulator [Spirochaetaceae bacterium]|nr:DeoR family transcriptional regulator [Spirochaetaceae bacterium]
MGSEVQRQRLKQKELVAALFVLFSEEYDRRGADTIFDIELPLCDVRSHLRAKVGVEYTSDAWIYTQIHKYEEEIGVALFRRAEIPGNGTSLGVARDIRAYAQKQHLYVTQKIKVANGILDLIHNERERDGGKGPISLLLGAGSTVTRLAEAIAERLSTLPYTWRIATHNLGVIQALGGSWPHHERVELFVPEGKVDPVTNIILGRNEELYGRMTFDWAVQGTSFLKEGALYVESEEETRVKAAIPRKATGRKVLVLTGHETAAAIPVATESFGRIGDYDFIVLPRAARERDVVSRFDLAIRELGDVIEPWVLNWNYEIFRSRRGG